MNPSTRGHSLSISLLENLREATKLFFQEENEQENLSQETVAFQVDQKIPSFIEGDLADMWWCDSVINHPDCRYQSLSKLAMISFSVFHGPLIESTFSGMSQIIDCHSTRTKITSYSSLQTIRHGLKSRNTSAINLFKRKSANQRIDRSLVYNFSRASRCYGEEKKVLQERKRNEEF